MRAFLINPGTTTALAAIFGSLAGALGSTLSTWVMQRHQDRRDLLTRNIVHREELYSDFITECAGLIVDAQENSTGNSTNLIPAYALLSRMRLSSSPHVLTTAEEVIKAILGHYAQPNMTSEEIRSRVARGEDPLRRFSDICRNELDSMQK